jgi:hypothetical protein
VGVALVEFSVFLIGDNVIRRCNNTFNGNAAWFVVPGAERFDFGHE